MENHRLIAVTALAGRMDSNSLLLLAMVAAFAEAGADTVSSELGQTANRQPRLITTWEPVPTGTNGAVSIIGTLAGILSAAVIAGISIAVVLLPWQYLPNCLGAATAGMFFDSVLGASLERQGRIGNDAANLLSTLLAAILAAATVPLFSIK